MKKALSVLCAGALAMTMAAPAFAEESTPFGTDSDHNNLTVNEDSITTDGVTNVTGGDFTISGGDALSSSTDPETSETVWADAGKVDFTIDNAEYTYTYNESGDPDNPGEELTGTAEMTVSSVTVNQLTSGSVQDAIETMVSNKNTVDSGLSGAELEALGEALTANGAINLQVTVQGVTTSTATQDGAGHVDMTFTINYNPTKFDGTTATAFYVVQNDKGEDILYSIPVTVNPADGTMTFSVKDINTTTGVIGRAIGATGFELTIVPGAQVTANTEQDTPVAPEVPGDDTVQPDVPTANPDNAGSDADKADADAASEEGADTGATSPKTGINA